ncbi:hypothetical protein WA158_000353 [Blastocystis sp. Blastoise]
MLSSETFDTNGVGQPIAQQAAAWSQYDQMQDPNMSVYYANMLNSGRPIPGPYSYMPQQFSRQGQIPAYANMQGLRQQMNIDPSEDLYGMGVNAQNRVQYMQMAQQPYRESIDTFMSPKIDMSNKNIAIGRDATKEEKKNYHYENDYSSKLMPSKDQGINRIHNMNGLASTASPIPAVMTSSQVTSRTPYPSINAATTVPTINNNNNNMNTINNNNTNTNTSNNNKIMNNVKNNSYQPLAKNVYIPSSSSSSSTSSSSTGSNINDIIHNVVTNTNSNNNISMKNNITVTNNMNSNNNNKATIFVDKDPSKDEMNIDVPTTIVTINNNKDNNKDSNSNNSNNSNSNNNTALPRQTSMPSQEGDIDLDLSISDHDSLTEEEDNEENKCSFEIIPISDYKIKKEKDTNKESQGTWKVGNNKFSIMGNEVWIQCHNPKCRKWRYIPREEVDTITFPFYCVSNYWDIDASSCAVSRYYTPTIRVRHDPCDLFKDHVIQSHFDIIPLVPRE